MAIYKFRITVDDEDTVYREIEFRSNQKFIDFHKSIVESLSINEPHSVYYYMSDNNWHKGDEFFVAKLNLPNSDFETKKRKMQLDDVIYDPHQQFIAFIETRIVITCFFELIKILPEDNRIMYPRTIKSVGEAPKPVRHAIEVPIIEDEKSLNSRASKKSILPLPSPVIEDVDLDEPLDEEIEEIEDVQEIEEDEFKAELEEVEPASFDEIELEGGFSEENIDEDSEFNEGSTDEFGMDNEYR